MAALPSSTSTPIPASTTARGFIATEHVHELGWEMHDWALLVVALEELPLGGEFAGQTVPPGTLMSFGEYWIEKSRLDRRGETPRIVSLDDYLVVRYRAASPIPPANISDRVAAVCEGVREPLGPRCGTSDVGARVNR